jgi:membrane protease YdiL (CAAX protease family)
MFLSIMAAPTNSLAGRASVFASFARHSPLIVFFLIAYLWTWTVWLVVPRAVRQHALGWKFDAFDIGLIMVGACGPTVAAFVTRWLAFRDLRICSAWTGWRSMVSGLMFGLAGLFAATVAIPAIALIRAPVSILALHWSALLHWNTYGVNYSTFLGGPVNEEPGWRGFALPKLQARFGPFLASLILAPLWAVWHLPLFLIPGWSSASPWQYLLILFGVSLLLTWAANLARFGILVAIVLHAFFNVSSGLLGALIEGLPTRPHDMTIYALAVCGTGIVFGSIGFRRLPTAAKLRLSSTHDV